MTWSKDHHFGRIVLHATVMARPRYESVDFLRAGELVTRPGERG